MPLPVEAVVFALIGLLAAAAALFLVPAYYPMARGLTIGTGLVSALLSGVITRITLANGHPATTVLITLVCTGLLTSVLARPDQAAKRGSHRRRRHAA
ncbi:hypothetical protein OG500_23695 [Kitasatospora sp. NBC_01250]|uniref:hypothetical protein n=1 Tax=unclassified Kitasatospora TaxID=2633591 RepID=UPI002E1234C7|nr:MULTISPECIES: hypothetical protein [unclassified Kitasatospora]WSJ69148.1 hypothetical protein OG294_25240 [Kitasatospora sp. NBC_01302]